MTGGGLFGKWLLHSRVDNIYCIERCRFFTVVMDYTLWLVQRNNASQTPMKIPWQSLSESTLTALIQEFVTREGTEYGPREVFINTKVEQVMGQLRRGKVEIVYDEETQTTSISTVVA